MRKFILLFLACLCGCSTPWQPDPAAAAKADGEFHKLADEFLAGYLAWRPGLGVSLGLHEYDGRVTDFSRASIRLEHARLRQFDQRLAAFPAKRLGPGASYDLRILRSAVRKQLFRFEDLQSFTHNPMTYAGAMDVNIYVKRDFAPLEERVRYVIAILEQAPGSFAAAKANLAESLPKPFVETAIQVAEGSAEFLGKDLVEALSVLKNDPLRARFNTANDRAVAEIRAYVKWLKETRLPRANSDYALGHFT